MAKATNGRVGYLHVPDMGAPGIYEFIKWYYGQIRKEGLIVDVRSNGGGNVSQLDHRAPATRSCWARASATPSEFPTTYPQTVFNGPMVALINETSASDGDIFPHYFRKAGLGPLIGKRTWGGVVGISGRGPLLDGGAVSVPLNATNDENGNYIIEGDGVDAGHRGRERPGVGHRRPRPAAGARHPGGAEGDGGEPASAAEEAGGSGEDGAAAVGRQESRKYSPRASKNGRTGTHSSGARTPRSRIRPSRIIPATIAGGKPVSRATAESGGPALRRRRQVRGRRDPAAGPARP